jgi:putative phosphotransacetylase
MEKTIEEITQKVLSEFLNESTTYQFGVSVGVSNRHLHLSKKDKDILFGSTYELTVLKELKQPGQYACNETVTIQSQKGEIKNVRILGPFRPQTQVEISRSDSRRLRINPPVRNSGDLLNTEAITIIGPKGSINLEQGCIIATRHIHLHTKDAQKYNISNNQIVRAKVRGDKPGVLGNVYCKVSDSYVLELHVDTDDANAFNLNNNDILEIER